MTTLTTTEDPLSEPLTTDRLLEKRVLSCMGPACRSQVWLLLLDSDERQLPVAIPCDDLRPEPTELEVDNLAAFAAGMLFDRGGSQLVTVWERQGRGSPTPTDARWAAAFAEHCERRGIPLRAQLLCHSRGVRVLRPAELRAAA
ncbi:hypothetical protein [Subtercola endophyticus]|uniref:hypothetical protein n=1 Tax=Subtercola endophyticus TaxID=2895559 RepID=UPI001E57344D|nr:hypothetical protein [Subtercola endophyticus]UFS58512.1 hypothetical protein LQ955_16140 [Subtercola endophyticus]